MSTPIVNGTPISVTYRNGQSEKVEVKELTIRQLYKFIEHISQGDTPALVALAVGKDLEWVDTLSIESFAILAKESIKVNFPKAAVMFGSDITVAGKLAPAFQRVAMAEAMLAGESSNSKSPVPAASGSAVETGTPSSISPPGA